MKKRHCPIEQESKKQALAELLALAAAGLIEIYFADESGFWQTPVIVRAWQFRGDEIGVFARTYQKFQNDLRNI